MNVKELSTMIVSIIVALMLTVSVLVPIVTSGLTVSGDSVTYENGGASFKEAKSGDVVVYTHFLGGGFSTTLNGVEASTSAQYNDLILSDGVYIRKTGESGANSGIAYSFSSDDPTFPNYIAEPTTTDVVVTVTFSSNTITVVASGNGNPDLTISAPYTWAYVPCPESDSEFVFTQVEGNSSPYVKNGEVPILCGAYTTGDLDTLYYYYDGEKYVSMDGATLDVNLSYSLAESTTDIYRLSVSCEVTLDDTTETFVPYRALVPMVVEGHKDSGAVYTLVEIIPILTVMGILIGVASWVLINRRT